MVITNIRADYENKKLYISADAGQGHVIASVKIDVCSTYNCSEEASTRAYVHTMTPSRILDNIAIDLSNVEANLQIDIRKTILFIYFYVDNADAGFDTMVPLYDEEGVKKSVFDSIKDKVLPCDRCSGIDMSIADKVIMYYGLVNAIDTKDYHYACEFINEIHNTASSSVNTCGCHGN